MEEFLRRFFLHVLPPGFARIRHFGLFSNRLRTVSIETCRTLLAEAGAPLIAPAETNPSHQFWACSECGGVMVLIERLTPAQTCIRPPPSTEVAA